MKKLPLHFGEKWAVSDEDIESENQFLDCGLCESEGGDQEFATLLRLPLEVPENEFDGNQAEEVEDGEYFDLDNIEYSENEIKGF